MKMRAFLAVAFGVFAVMQAPVSDAQDYPGKPVHLIVPFPPGSSIDIMARGFAQALDSRFNQRVIVQNRGGAAMTIGMTTMVQAAPDGYTLLYSPVTPLVVQPYRMKDLPYAREAIAPLCQTFENIYVVAAGPKSALSTIQELLDQPSLSQLRVKDHRKGVLC